MSLADHPEVGPAAAAVLEALTARVAPGGDAEDLALVCVAVASAFIVAAAEAAGKPESVDARVKRAQAFLASMADFHVARGTRPGELLDALPKPAPRRFEGGNIIEFGKREGEPR